MESIQNITKQNRKRSSTNHTQPISQMQKQYLRGVNETIRWIFFSQMKKFRIVQWQSICCLSENSVPWDNIAPTAKMLASVLRINCFSESGYWMTGSLVNNSLEWSKAFKNISSCLISAPFLKPRLNGRRIFAAFMNFRLHSSNPKKTTEFLCWSSWSRSPQ